MKSYDQMSDSDCARLARRIKEDVFVPTSTFRTRVFLCGADIAKPGTLRGQLADLLSSGPFSVLFELIYPEDIFDELLYNRESQDLMSLENLLVKSVDAVVIIPESPGSYTELGAFVNNPELRKKVICVIDKKYKTEKSFIIRGPVRLIKEHSSERVIFVDRSKIDLDFLKLRKQLFALREVRVISSELNLLQIESFMLPTIYLLEPVSRVFLTKLVGALVSNNSLAFQLTATALATLMKKKQIEISDNMYSLTQVGLQNYLQLQDKSQKRAKPERVLLDNFRLEVLNWKLRGKRLSV